jgi:hypothetical protein
MHINLHGEPGDQGRPRKQKNKKKNLPQVCYLMTLLVSRLYTANDRMINRYGGVEGMRSGRGNQSTRRKPAPVPFCPSQNPNELTWA